MTRRDLLQFAPLPFAGAAAPSRAAQDRAFAEVRMHNGAPTLFLDGRPTYYSGMWVSSPRPGHWGHVNWSAEHPANGDADTAQRTAATGTHIYAFGVGNEWCGPGEGRSGHFDFSAVEGGFRQILKTDPEARLHLRIQLEQGRSSRRGGPSWWQTVYPGECEVTTKGPQREQSYASSVWRREAKEFLRRYVEHIRAIGLERRVIAYQVMAGQSGEWTKWSSAGTQECGDYSEPMRRHFGAYLRAKYGSEAALRAAWNDPQATFETAAAPSQQEQLQTRHYSFRDPAVEQRVIDYFTCLAELCSDLVIDFCRTIKEATAGRAMAGAFYGYTLFGAYNQGFFGERSAGTGFYGDTGEGNSTAFSKIQRNGHLGFGRILDSPWVDFVVSPIGYGFRSVGGDGPGAFLTESVRLHGKLCVVEDDVRLHDAPEDRRRPPLRYARARTIEESVAFLRRNFARALIHGQGAWRAPVADRNLYPVLKRFNELGAFALTIDRAPAAEIAVLVDEESMIYETPRYNLNLASIPNQILQGIARIGAPADFYLLDDLVEGKLPPYRLYIFLNAYRLDSRRRERLARAIRRDGRVALWIYAPGYIDAAPSVENMKTLTGLSFATGELPWPAFMHVVDFAHPITAGLPQDLFWNFNSPLGPLFCLDDPDARTLGNVVFSQGSCVPGLGVRTFSEWTSIYCAIPTIPAPVLRGIARFSGAHLYNEQGDVLHASRNLLCVHTISGGNRKFRLPRRVEEVFDLFNHKSIARDAAEFDVLLSPGSTEAYYTGGRDALRRLRVS